VVTAAARAATRLPSCAVAYTLDEFHEQQQVWREAGEAWKLQGEVPHPVLVERSCGHTEEMQLPLRVYDGTISRAADHPCKACRAAMAASFTEDDEAAARRAEQLGLAQLRGTERQVSWALRLRDEAIAHHGLPRIEQVVREQVYSSWWIDHRERLHDTDLMHGRPRGDDT
jgi:hypothetical protein